MATATREAMAVPATARYRAEADLYGALGDEVRLAILYRLEAGECHVTGLCAAVEKRQQAVSHHLTILKLRGLIELERRGKSNYYRLTTEGREAMRRTGLA